MTPLRILILIILLYILFRLLIGGKKIARKKPGGAQQLHDVLVEDPVCKTCIPKKQAITLSENGNSIYFCSSECRDKYQANKGE
jgi:YHS domain-containing protein